jgi:ectoine hydroxylase-related dioxygenase (phytanoyl-CoA dioxygenase family)
MDINNLKSQYEERGIIVIPNVFTEQECAEIKRQSYSVVDRDITNAGYKYEPREYSYGKKALIFFPALANDYLNKIRTDERMVNLVRTFIGDNVKQINNQVYFREANTMDQFAWHRDTMFREPQNFKNDVVDDYFQTIIAVDDITLDNGVVEFIEGSHKWEHWPTPAKLRVFNRGDLQGTKYVAKKGSVLIWTVTIVHGSEPNQSNADRMTYMNGFCRSKSALTYPDYLINGKIVEKLNPDLIP